MAIGDWEGMSCGAMHKFTKRPKVCQTCNCKSLRYKELRFVSAVSGASCGVDLAVDFNIGKLVPVEIKTIDKEEFKKLEMPLAEKRKRGALYCRILKEADEIGRAHV